MAEAENKLKREDADEESMVMDATVTGVPQVTASVVLPDVQKEAAGSIADAEPSASVLVKVTEQAPIATVTKEGVEDVVGVADEGKSDNIATKEDGKNKSTVKRGKGSTPSRSVKKRQDRKKRKAAGNDGGADPSESVLVKVENALAVTTGRNEDKAGEEGGDNDGQELSDNDNDGKVEMPETAAASTVAMMSAVVTAEIGKDDDGKEVSDKGKVDSTLSKKNKKRKKSNKARVAAEEAAGKAEVGAVKRLSDTKGPAGMIFMCSSKTKKECFKYKIFGMPAGRKEMVAKIYKGMKLFLYDIDLKLLYGSYVAASKGGYDIRPKAFNSAFPSQVRFKVLKEYSPLSQEKIKAAIKSNYYKKNMFNCELSAEQVQKLTKLFVEATKASKPSDSRAPRKMTSESLSRETKRRQYKGTGDHMLPRSHDRCEWSILAARDLDAQPFSDFFIRCYASTGGGRRVRVDSRVIPSSCQPQWNLLAQLECQGDVDHTSELLEKHGVVFELRRRKAVLSLFSQLSSSKLVGTASASWRDLLVSGETSGERWMTFDIGSIGGPKPPAVLVRVKILPPAMVGMAGRRVAPTAELEKCRCRYCQWNLEEEDVFALATSVVSC